MRSEGGARSNPSVQFVSERSGAVACCFPLLLTCALLLLTSSRSKAMSIVAGARGLCRKHGGGYHTCLVSSCSGNARTKGGFCTRHGGKDGFCTTPGCETPRAPKSLVCIKHGANGTCSVSGCTTNAFRRTGVCWTHTVGRALCSAEGCSGFAHARGVCAVHGGRRPQKVCSADGCGTTAAARGLCKKHGAYGYCTYEDCTAGIYTKSAGTCAQHGGRSRPSCLVDGCSSTAQARRLCRTHASEPTIVCTTNGCIRFLLASHPICVKHGPSKRSTLD